MHPLVEGVSSFLAERGAPSDAHIMVGCSGGPDSAALAHIAATLVSAGRLGRVTLVHVDHQLRDGADADAEAVRALASRVAADVVVVAVNVDCTRASLEEAAREARYQAFERVAEEGRAHAVLLAHNRSDQAETVIMRMLRGAGVVGLAAIPPVRGRYWRPLLEASRAAIEAYCTDHDIQTVHDPMNDDRRFLRVRVRDDVMPVLAEENPAIEDALCRLAAAAGENKQVWDYAARALLSAATDEGSLDVDQLAAAPVGVTKRALAIAARAAGTGPLEARHHDSLLELISRPIGGTVTVDLTNGRAIREYGRLRFECEAAKHSGKNVDVVGKNGPYTVRSWQHGDRMRPARLKGRSRKLSDLYVDAKVPRLRRGDAVVVTRDRDGEIVWAEFVGYSFDCEVEVTLTSHPAMATNND